MTVMALGFGRADRIIPIVKFKLLDKFEREEDFRAAIVTAEKDFLFREEPS